MSVNPHKLNPREIAICMITQYPQWYPGPARGLSNIDKVRGDLALQSIDLSAKKGYQTVIGYHENSFPFNQLLHKITGTILVKRTTHKSSPAKRQVIEEASKLPGVKVIVLSEPEKVSFIKECIEQTVSPIIEGKADIIIPKRDPDLFKQTYPDYMYASEKEGIALYNEELRSHGLIKNETEDFDVFFGPHVFANRPEIISLFLQQYFLEVKNIAFPKVYFDAEELSNTQFFPIVRALQKDFQIKSIIVPFHYPQSQKENEEIHARDVFIEKRRAQRLGLIIELLHFVSFLEKNRASRVEKSD